MEGIEEIIIKSCNRVYETLGFGLMETTYEKALKVELQSRYIPCDNEVYVNLDYQDINGEKHFLTSLRIDILIKKPRIILELKTIKGELKKKDKEYYQVKRYGKLMGIDNLYLVNFGLSKLEIYRCNGDEFEMLV